MMNDEELIEKLKRAVKFEHTGAQKEILWGRLLAYLDTEQKDLGFWHFSLRFTHLVIVVLIIFLTSTGVTFAARASLPGQPLYPVKRLSEEADLFIKFDQKAKKEAKIKLTTRRVEEINKLVLEDPEKAEEALDEYEGQIEQYKNEYSEDPELAQSFNATLMINNEVLQATADQAPEEMQERIRALIAEEEPSQEDKEEGVVEGEEIQEGVEDESTAPSVEQLNP